MEWQCCFVIGWWGEDFLERGAIVIDSFWVIRESLWLERIFE